VQHPGVDHVTFVGSASVGQSVARQCLDRFIPVELEMGGKSPNIVMGDADVDCAIPVIVRALVQNAGQSCSAGSRVLIAREIYDEVIEKLRSALQSLSIGPGVDDHDVGPLRCSPYRLRPGVGSAINGHAACSRVQHGMEHADAAYVRGERAVAVSVPAVLEFDHIAPELPQQVSGHRPREVGGEVGDSEATHLLIALRRHQVSHRLPSHR